MVENFIIARGWVQMIMELGQKGGCLNLGFKDIEDENIKS